MKHKKDSYKNKSKVCNYASKVVWYRRKNGWSQETLAFKAGISRKTLSRLETGDPGITYRTMKSVFKVLGIEICKECVGCRDGGNEDSKKNVGGIIIVLRNSLQRSKSIIGSR